MGRRRGQRRGRRRRKGEREGRGRQTGRRKRKGRRGRGEEEGYMASRTLLEFLEPKPGVLGCLVVIQYTFSFSSQFELGFYILKLA